MEVVQVLGCLRITILPCLDVMNAAALPQSHGPKNTSTLCSYLVFQGDPPGAVDLSLTLDYLNKMYPLRLSYPPTVLLEARNVFEFLGRMVAVGIDIGLVEQ